jgi:dipeptidyl aminopeptidase/acylaminoacyl peptidase
VPGRADAPPPDGTFAGQDRNGDGRLNADEVPDALRARFAEVDGDGDGYIAESEWDRAASPAPGGPPGRGKVIARRIFTAADDFVVDVWHNGRRVPDDKREMVGENYGATSEKIEVEVREGDWLVFNVANNRLRWGGAYYFGAAGVNDEEPRIGFTTAPGDGRWSYCDDPARVPAFIAHPRYLADQAARAPENPWPGGDGEMKARVPEWDGKPVWGRERTTWLKFIAPPAGATASAPAAGSGPAPDAAKSAAADDKPDVARSDAAGSAAGKPETGAAAAPAVTLKKRATLNGHPALVFCVAVSPDGRKVASGSAPNMTTGEGREGVATLIVWDVANGGKTRGIIPIEQSVTSLAVTPDGKSVIAPVGNGLSVFDLKTGRLTATLPGPPRTNTTSVAVSPDGKVVAGGFTTNEVVLWSLTKREPLRTLRGHTGGVLTLAFSPDGKQLASGSGGEDNTVRLWDVATGRAERTLTAEGASSPVTCVAYTPDGSRLASVNSGDSPQFWDPRTGRHLLSLGGDEVLSFRFVCISRDGRRLATASFDPLKMKWVVVLWDAATGRRLATAEDGDGQVNAVAFTPGGAGLVSSGGNTVKLWDITPAP